MCRFALRLSCGKAKGKTTAALQAFPTALRGLHARVHALFPVFTAAWSFFVGAARSASKLPLVHRSDKARSGPVPVMFLSRQSAYSVLVPPPLLLSSLDPLCFRSYAP